MTYKKSQPLSSAFTLKKLMRMSINGMCHLYIAALFSIKQNLKQMQRERESARESASALCVRQWFSTFIMLQSFNTVDTPNIKLFLFLLHNCNFAILHCNVNVICRASDRWPWERIIQSPRGHNPQVENIIQRHLACHYHIVFNSFALLSVKFSFLSCSTLSGAFQRIFFCVHLHTRLFPQSSFNAVEFLGEESIHYLSQGHSLLCKNNIHNSC